MGAGSNLAALGLLFSGLAGQWLSEGDGWLSEGDGWLSEGDGWLSEGDGWLSEERRVAK